MAADDRRPSTFNSLGSLPPKESIGFKLDHGGNSVEVGCGPKKILGALVIKENSFSAPILESNYVGKGKDLALVSVWKTPKYFKPVTCSKDVEASSSGMNLFVNKFGFSNAIPGNSVINANSNIDINKGIHKEKGVPLEQGKVSVLEGKILEPSVLNGSIESSALYKEVFNPWAKKPYIKLNFNESSLVLTEDGKAVKLIEDKELMNANRLSNSLVVKIFGKELPPSNVAWELRRQWAQFGQFHFTSIGKGWFLCSFSKSEALEEILSGGPWFVNGFIIGMERWSPEFSPNSNKGLSSPIWIRMPQLPLQCWDEDNVARIASRIGLPLMLDGNMFQWGRRESVVPFS